MARLLRFAFTITSLAFLAVTAHAQISFTTAIDLALRNNPRVLMAQADVDKARALLSEARDVYIPAVVGGSGLGYSYGFPVGQPSIYNFNAQSLVFNFSQHDYIRAARSGLEAANLALMDARQAVAEEAAIAYLALDRDQQREIALNDEKHYASRLVSIVQDRLDAGQDTGIDLTTARLTNAQIRLTTLRDEDETEYDRAKLARLIGLPEPGLTTLTSSLPTSGTWLTPVVSTGLPTAPGILAAYANAKSKQEQAYGDARYERRPQISFGAQYNRFAAYNNYAEYYNHFQQNNAEIGIQISLPIVDYVHRAKARESAADAVHALRDADQQRDQFLDGRLKLKHASAELAARSEVADLDQQLAQQQLDAMLLQLQGNGNSGGRQMSPKDEQNARIAEREKYLSYLDTNLQLRQTQINLLRQTGQLEPWLKSLSAHPQTP
ncbi:TolC family protein [Granulicella arctica]|uniref:TolC family protein n=1 Tax=Granulicella arctica TaxID=940613 RepID=UPI0021DF4A6A|nr:TolC family protein [Granulicella arctica]